jgi:hypothetical protein
MSISRRTLTWALVLSAVSAQHVFAQAGPFEYALGRTTLSEARDHWRASGAQILRAGHLALGTGSGIDGRSQTSAEKVLLVDMAGIDFEGITSARFCFYDEKLYRIQASLRPGLLQAKRDLLYDQEQLRALESRLRQKYGRPAEEHRSPFIKKTDGPDVLLWKVDGNSLQFVSNLVNGGLVLTNEPTEVSIKKYVKEYCKTVNTKERIVCW